MNNTASVYRQERNSKLPFYALAVLFCSVLRIAFLPFYPLIILFIFYAFHWRLRKNAAFVFIAVAVLWILSLRNGWYPKYNLLSLYYYLPFLLLLFSSPPRHIHSNSHLKNFMTALTIIAIANNIIGLIQYGLNPGDDNFVGLYGRFTVSQNGLSLINGLLFFYHFSIFLHTKKIASLIWSSFFIACCVLGFYGAGIMALFVSVSLYFLKGKIKNLATVVIVIFITAIVSAAIMRAISPNTLDYNIAIIKRFIHSSPENTPRKLTAFRNYAESYFVHPVDFLFGSGPGTFNSRSAFIVGSPTYFNFNAIKSADQPFYFKNYAYPLWNSTNTGPYDGFMNQPFSSLLSLLGEYGFLFTLLLLALMTKNFLAMGSARDADRISKELKLSRGLYRFCWLYVSTLICIDNYIEYPEIIALLIIIAKLCEQSIKSAERIQTIND